MALGLGVIDLAGGTIEVIKYANEPHTFFSAEPTSAATRDALARIVAFCMAQ